MSHSDSNCLFVYGSLRSSLQSQAYQYVAQYFNLLGSCRVKGKLYDLGPYPAAVPVDTDDFIVGELYRIKKDNEFSWAIAQLDDYEGVVVEAHEHQLYRRELTDAYVNDETVKAWIYWYNGDISAATLITSGDILDYNGNK